MTGSARISDCGTYRYELTRLWGQGPEACFVMLNPSTADAAKDDPTIRRCIGFAKREGCGSLSVVNLFAFRSPSPKVLASYTGDKIGSSNDKSIVDAVWRATGPVICAWGASSPHGWRESDVMRLISGRATYCLGVTKDGSPKHPLYVRADAPLLPYAGRGLK